MENDPIQQKLKEVKQTFRQMMDGAVAQSMRDKGLSYHLSWGATIPRLRQMADGLKAEFSDLNVQSPSPNPQSSYLYRLAIALWKENIRECKVLATMLMPPGEILPEVVDIWMEQTETVEIAEQAAMNLYQHLPFAAEKAFQWIATPTPLFQLCGFHVLSRLFLQGLEPDERGINEYLDQAITALQGDNVSVRKAALNSLQRFAALALVYERLAKSALRASGLPPTAIF